MQLILATFFSLFFFFFSSRRRHTRSLRDWSSDVCSSDLFPGRTKRSTLKGRASMTAGPRKLDLTPNAITVLERRYLVKDEQGRPAESPEDLFWRVARTVAEPDASYGASRKAVETLAETFFELMATRVWMPNSPTLMNAGRPLGQLSAC